MSATRSVVDIADMRPTRRRRSLGATRVMSYGFTAFALFALASMLVLFVWQSLPVWRHAGIGYLIGREWYFRRDQFGALPMLYGSAMVAAIALLLAAPVGIGAAVFTAEYLPRRARLLLKLVIELLAGVPSVVYGLLGILLLRNYVYAGLRAVGFDPLSGDSLLTAGLLLAVMVLPTIMTLADDALQSVPAQQRQAARGLGLTRAQTVLSVSLPQARRGLVAAVLLGLGRALGETIAVFLVVGRQDNQWPANVFSLKPLINAGQTITSKLGGAETNIAYGSSLHWAAIVGLGLLLMVVVAAVTLLGAWLEATVDTHTRIVPAHHLIEVALVALIGLLLVLQRKVLLVKLLDNFIRRNGRRWLDGVVFAAVTACALITCGVLTLIVVAILLRGLPAVSWQFLTEQIRLVGASGGIFYNLVGTSILIAAAAVVSTPIALGLALTHGVYLKSERARRNLGLLLYTLNGVPSILFGIFGLIVFVKFFGWGKSWLSGGILLGFMILPTVTVSLIERIKVLPAKYVEAAYGLGLSQSQVVWSVILPQTFGGLITGLLLGLARAAGETAPIMFTATIFAGASLPHGVKESPVLSLPYHIFILAQDSFDPGVGAKVWGTATVLLALVFILSAVALPLRLKVHEEARNV